MVKINFPKYATRSDCHCCLIMVLSYLDMAAADSSRLLQGMTLFSIQLLHVGNKCLFLSHIHTVDEIGSACYLPLCESVTDENYDAAVFGDPLSFHLIPIILEVLQDPVNCDNHLTIISAQ